MGIQLEEVDAALLDIGVIVNRDLYAHALWRQTWPDERLVACAIRWSPHLSTVLVTTRRILFHISNYEPLDLDDVKSVEVIKRGLFPRSRYVNVDVARVGVLELDPGTYRREAAEHLASSLDTARSAPRSAPVSTEKAWEPYRDAVGECERCGARAWRQGVTARQGGPRRMVCSACEDLANDGDPASGVGIGERGTSGSSDPVATVGL